MKPEPTPLENGKCFVCDKKITRVPHVESDAFCSSVCCRVYFETTHLITTSTAKPT